MKLGKIGITFVCGALTICMGLVGCGTKGEGASPSGAPSAKDMHPNATQQVQSQDSQTQQVQEMGYDAGRGVAYEEPDGYGYDAAAPVEVAPVDEVQGTEYPTNEAPAEVPVEVPVAAPSDVSQTSDACMGDVVLRD